MKVAELIKLLSGLPPEAEIFKEEGEEAYLWDGAMDTVYVVATGDWRYDKYANVDLIFNEEELPDEPNWVVAVTI